MSHFYIIYKINNKINGKFYIGVHKTTDVNDDYYGSGHSIKAAIEKYGKENFKKEILHIFTNAKTAFKKEKEIVNENMLKNENCYNIKKGGQGGFDHIRATGLHKSVKGTRVMHNPSTNENKKIKIINTEQYLQIGWVYGYSALAKERMSCAGKIKIQTEEHRRNNSNAKKNARVMINNTTGIKKFIKTSLICEYEKNGWRVYTEQYVRKSTTQIKKCNY